MRDQARESYKSAGDDGVRVFVNVCVLCIRVTVGGREGEGGNKGKQQAQFVPEKKHKRGQAWLRLSLDVCMYVCVCASGAFCTFLFFWGCRCSKKKRKKWRSVSEASKQRDGGRTRKQHTHEEKVRERHEMDMRHAATREAVPFKQKRPKRHTEEAVKKERGSNADGEATRT